MPAYLSLDLDSVAVDPALLRRLPPGLAAYYLALPLSSEDGSISVAMAHPENEAAVAVLSALLGAPVVPVRARGAAIRQALASAAVRPDEQPRVLQWGDDHLSLAAAGALTARFASAFAAPITTLTAPEIDLQAALAVARAGAYDLAVLCAPATVAPASLWEQAATSLLLLATPPAALRRILVVLRGYSADCHALEWLAPLLREPGVSVTLLPLPPAAAPDSLSPLSLRGPQNGHLQECLRHPALQAAPVSVRLRQGRAVEQVVAEARHGAHDLVVIAAEGYGQFVSHILHALEGEGGRRHSYFILKPPATGETVTPAIPGETG